MQKEKTIHQLLKEYNFNYELLSYSKSKLLVIISEYKFNNLHVKTLLTHLNTRLMKNSNGNKKVKPVSERTLKRHLAELKDLNFITTRRNDGSNQWSRWISEENLEVIHNYFGSVVEALGQSDIAIQQLERKVKDLELKLSIAEGRIKVMGKAAVEKLAPTMAPRIERKPVTTIEEDNRDRRFYNNFNENLIIDQDLIEYYYKHLKPKKRLMDKMRTYKYESMLNNYIRDRKEVHDECSQIKL